MPDGLLEYLPERDGNPHPLGRNIIWHDPRNRQFRALAAVTPAPPRRRISWYSNDVYDQGIDPSCTAEAAVGVCRTQPNTVPFGRARGLYDESGERYTLYREAQKVDPWPGEDYDGSSTDAPFRVLRDRGHITGWRWLFGVDEVRQWVQQHGPCAVGTNWHDTMFHPDGKGVVRPAGPVVGGHAYRVIGYDVRRRMFRCVNSWGRGWGDNGRFWIEDNALGDLLAANGEAVTVAPPDA